MLDLTLNQSDSTRSANLELKIQSRVTSELEKIAKEEASRLVSSAQAASNEPTKKQRTWYLDEVTGVAAERERREQLSHDSVAQEIDDLKKKLAGHKKLEAASPAVEKAKTELVQCLRINDRRPLDCWKEKEAFKREVNRLEKEFVEKTVR
jgi:altered-inheritance-of-mitochondria protein 13